MLSCTGVRVDGGSGRGDFADVFSAVALDSTGGLVQGVALGDARAVVVLLLLFVTEGCAARKLGGAPHARIALSCLRSTGSEADPIVALVG